MFRNITLGRYYPADSLIHSLDPRVKLSGTAIFIAAVFIINNLWGFIYIIALLLSAISLSKVPIKHMLKGLRAIWIFVVLAVVFNLFSGEGRLIWQWWILKLTHEGILRAVFFALRLVCVVLGSGLLTYTTTPSSLTAGLERAFSHLKWLRFPAHETAMMMSIALRFIPILADEADKITKAQLARGAEIGSGGLINRAKGMIPVIIPLFVSAFRRAANLALAMEARCYHGGEGRTKLHPLRYGSRDKKAYVIIFLALAAAIAIRILMDRFVSTGRI